MAYLPFRAVGQPGQKTPLTLAVTDIDDASGNDLPIELIHGEIEIVGPGQGLPGDCDGQLTVADAICALKMSVGLMLVNVDVTADGRVTYGDARQIMQRIP